MERTDRREPIALSELKPYAKGAAYSYTLGAFPTFELLKVKAESADRVLVHSSYRDEGKLLKLCSELKVPYSANDRLVARFGGKDNCFALGVFRKFQSRLNGERPHLVLVNPGNMGNLGTIIRTAIGLGIDNIGIIKPAADIFAPKTVRASMGAIFRLSFQLFESFEAYRRECPAHLLFPFLTGGKVPLGPGLAPPGRPYSLIFGNEATGLDDSFLKIGAGIYIPQSDGVDSFNLVTAVGIGAYVFTESTRNIFK